MHNAIAHFVGLVSWIMWIFLEICHFSSSWKYSSQCPVIEEDESKVFSQYETKTINLFLKNMCSATRPRLHNVSKESNASKFRESKSAINVKMKILHSLKLRES